MKININSTFNKESNKWTSTGVITFLCEGVRKFKFTTDEFTCKSQSQVDCNNALIHSYSVITSDNLESDALELAKARDRGSWIDVAIQARLINARSPFCRIPEIADDFDEPLPERQCEDEGSCESCQ